MNPQIQILTRIWCEFAGEMDQVLIGQGRDYHSGLATDFYIFPGAVIVQGYLDASMKEIADWDMARLPSVHLAAVQDFWDNISRLAWCDGIGPLLLIKAAAAGESKYRHAFAADLRNLLQGAHVAAYAQTVSTFLKALFPDLAADEATQLQPRIAAALSAYYEMTHHFLSQNLSQP